MVSGKREKIRRIGNECARSEGNNEIKNVTTGMSRKRYMLFE